MLSELPSLNARQLSHSLQASPSAVGLEQLIVLAKIRAHEVLPTPRDPQNQIAVGQSMGSYCILERGRESLLPDNAIERRRRYFLAETI